MRVWACWVWVAILLVGLITAAGAQAKQSESSSSNSPKHIKKPAGPVESGVDGGAVTNGAYRNKALALSCNVPAGWVLRTEEMNKQEDFGDAGADNSHFSQKQGEVGHPATEKSSNDSRAALDGAAGGGCPNTCNRVLLAAFSRPPEARGAEVNASIVIAAESVAAYPGLKEAAQYFGPLTEVAKAQGFTVDEEPYEVAMGSKVLVRGDFHKDVGTRVMRQSTLAWLANGYAVSITVIGGTEDEVEELIDGVSFSAK